jgi:peptidoglycan/LPS O-acetylase OafA/YrhL
VVLLALTALAAVAIAAASYYALERPLLRFKRYSRTPPV